MSNLRRSLPPRSRSPASQPRASPKTPALARLRARLRSFDGARGAQPPQVGVRRADVRVPHRSPGVGSPPHRVRLHRYAGGRAGGHASRSPLAPRIAASGSGRDSPSDAALAWRSGRRADLFPLGGRRAMPRALSARAHPGPPSPPPIRGRSRRFQRRARLHLEDGHGSSLRGRSQRSGIQPQWVLSAFTAR